MSALVIFDCDGVLVDSEWLGCEVESELLREVGISLTPGELFTRFVGSTVARMFAEIQSDTGVALGPEFTERHALALKAAFTDRLRALNGVAEVIADLKCSAAVASNSALSRVRHSLQVTGLERHFSANRVFSAEAVANPKPAPDLYLHVLKQTRADPSQSIVIEDSASGIRAACASGLRALGFTGASHTAPDHDERLRQAGAVEAFSHMSQLPELLERYL